MKVVEKVNEQGGHEYTFDNGAWVCITPGEGTWEYQKGDDEDTYISGGYVVDGCTVIDYDGCFELPKEVAIALTAKGYMLDL